MTEPLRKRRFRISLRAMIVLVLVVGGALGWKVNRVRTQRQAVAAIKAARGDVFYDFEFWGQKASGNCEFGPPGEPWAPRWLRKSVGDEFFQEVTGVNFNHVPSPEVWPAVGKLNHLITVNFNNAGAKLQGVSGLRSLTRLRFVSVSGGMIDDASLDEIATIPGLEEFRSFNAVLTDDGLRRLARARGLVALELFSMWEVSDAGLAHLAKLDRLKELHLSYARDFTDRSLKELAPILPNLKILHLAPTSMTDQGMALLKVCDHLEELSLESREITDAGLQSLTGLKNLKSLAIVGAKITDAGLVHVRKMPGLKRVDIDSNSEQPTPEAIDALKAERPSLEVNVHIKNP